TPSFAKAMLRSWILAKVEIKGEFTREKGHEGLDIDMPIILEAYHSGEALSEVGDKTRRSKVQSCDKQDKLTFVEIIGHEKSLNG
ncbi:hypothetical protein A2U01_0077535, partial [Trifolium medium]|nr:hypothetical protein [Trifolium medium]